MSEQVTLDERGRRVASNEALFRDVNKRLLELDDTLSVGTGKIEIICECGNLKCIDLITIERADYERIRDESTWFVVIPGHEVVAVEAVISRHGRHDVVEKRFEASEEAAERDPRS